MKPVRWIVLSGLVALMIVGPAQASASTISVGGVVACSSGNVQGVWVQSSKGGSRWASWRKMALSARYASYAASLSTSLPTSIQLRVGCGGSPSHWATTNNSPYRSAGGSKVLNAICDARGHCSWPRTGKLASSNLGAPKYCTWGALDQWRRYSGYYPNWSGNASAWPTTAAQNGWTVTSVPMPKAMVVTSTSGAGHVAWVNSVGVSSSGSVSINITEMNYDGTATYATGHVRTRTISASSSYRYIPVP